MFRRLLAPIFFALAMTGTALAQDAPPQQVQVWSIPETVRLGQAIWRQDMASARATDAFLAAYAGKLPEGLIGWIVVEDGRNQRVRFLAGTMDAPRAFKDVVVDDHLRAGAVVDAADLTLTPDELARFSARMTAALGIGTLRCAARYNPVILKNPDGEGWLVWLLASTTQPGLVPMGGHYRFHISADGKTVERREQLSSSCLDMDSSQVRQGGQIAGLFTNVIVAPQPLEIHVFLSLLNQLPIYTSAGDKLWEVNGARIQPVNR